MGGSKTGARACMGQTEADQLVYSCLQLWKGRRGLGEEAGSRREPGAPQKIEQPPGLVVGAEAVPIPAPPNTDDKWARVLGRQTRLCWGHRSPSPGSHTAVLPGGTAHPTSQSGPLDCGGALLLGPTSDWSLGGELVWGPSQQLLTPQGPRGCVAPALHACAQPETPPDASMHPTHPEACSRTPVSQTVTK